MSWFDKNDEEALDHKRKLSEAAIEAFSGSKKDKEKDSNKSSSLFSGLKNLFSNAGSGFDDHAVTSGNDTGGAGRAGVKFGYLRKDLRDPKKIMKLVDRIIVEAIKNQNWDQIWIYKNNGEDVDDNLSKFLAHRLQQAASVLLADPSMISKKSSREFVKDVQKTYRSLGFYDGNTREYVQRMMRAHVNFNAQPEGQRPCDAGFFNHLFGQDKPSV
jgi:hypothetical protein